MNSKKNFIYYVSDWFFLYLNPNVKRPWEVIRPSQVDAQLLAKVLARCIPPTPPPNTYSVWLSITHGCCLSGYADSLGYAGYCTAWHLNPKL